MSKLKLGSNAIFTGPQQGLTVLENKMIYACSGFIGVTNTETTLLEFSTPKGVIEARIQFNYVHESGGGADEDFFYRVYFNNIEIQGYLVNSATTSIDKGPLDLIIPPLTLVKCTADNTTDSTSRNQCVTIAGKLHE